MRTEDAYRVGNMLLNEEAHLLDSRDWAGWLELFEADCTFHVPAWIDEVTETDNPKQQLSLIYYESRIGLEERVARIVSRKSVASTPMPRTLHCKSNVHVISATSEEIEIAAYGVTYVFDARKGQSLNLFCRYGYLLCNHGMVWRIRKKKVSLLNDMLPGVLDIYHI